MAFQKALVTQVHYIVGSSGSVTAATAQTDLSAGPTNRELDGPVTHDGEVRTSEDGAARDTLAASYGTSGQIPVKVDPSSTPTWETDLEGASDSGEPVLFYLEMADQGDATDTRYVKIGADGLTINMTPRMGTGDPEGFVMRNINFADTSASHADDPLVSFVDLSP